MISRIASSVSKNLLRRSLERTVMGGMFVTLVKTGIVENIQIGANFTPEEIARFTSLFKELCDMFTWSYDEITIIDPSIVEKKINIYDNAKQFRQQLRPFHLHKAAAIKTEIPSFDPPEMVPSAYMTVQTINS